MFKPLTLAMLVILSTVSTALRADDAALLPLLKVTPGQLPSQVKPSNEQVTLQPVPAGQPGLLQVAIAPGDAAYPGIAITPADADHWNLVNYGHIDATITNTCDHPLKLNLRVDNPSGPRGGPWNAEPLALEPGQTQTVTVVFGFQYYHQIAYPLQPAAVSRLMLFTGKTDSPLSFRIDSITAAGQSGEVPDGQQWIMRSTPDRGILIGSDVQPSGPDRQLSATGGASVSTSDNQLLLQFPANAAAASVTLKPVKGRWNLGAGNQLAVVLKNTGSAECTPTVTLDSEGGPIHQTGSPLAPGQSQTIIVSYLPDSPWQGINNGNESSNKDSKPGTGTTFLSDKVKSVSFSAACASAASLTVQSVATQVQTMTPPDWLGKRPPVEGDWVVTFDDDFAGSSIDLSKWNNTGPNHWDNISTWSKANITVADGKARILCEHRASHHNDDPKQPQRYFTAGYLDTRDKFSQRYGYFESRMKLPTARGLWPAFWMMPDRGPAVTDRHARYTTSDDGMEFDIMEHLAVLGPNRYNIAMHWDDYGPSHKKTGTGCVYFQPDADGYITTGLLWLPGKAVYYCNGIEVARWENPRVSGAAGYMMFTVPIGGWDGNVWLGQGLPDDWFIDYVRVWQLREYLPPEPGR